MAGGDNRIRVADGVDRISELPVHLREHILGCLSIKDAVATSVLSSKMKFCWTGLRTLIFDWEFWGCYGDNELVEHARAIDRVLMLHSGPIHEFTLRIPEIKDTTLDINAWLHVLSNNGVQNIDIGASDFEDSTFPIPSSLFHCRLLEKLCLFNCKITLPSEFKGCANLKSLSLDNVDIASSLLGSLISGCVLIETLSLTEFVLEEPLTLEALNLKTFYFDGLGVGKIIFKDIPKLTCVTLLSTGEGCKIKSYNTLNQLCSLYKIEELTFDCHLLEPLSQNFPSITPTPLENLKTLTMKCVDLYVPDDILFTLYLMRTAPNLQNLTIHLESITVELYAQSKKLQGLAAELLKSEATKHTSCSSLQTINIRGIEDLQHEILLIELLKKRCQKLNVGTKMPRFKRSHQVTNMIRINKIVNLWNM
ncbi:unnamed protein product [Rhodiola kirilowii]